MTGAGFTQLALKQVVPHCSTLSCQATSMNAAGSLSISVIFYSVSALVF